ncbi:Cro/Cl family transcriptional regulator, partial [Vibrio anguillarum]|nr:Cro/Cl family transcriptional regulator [Vibrio anguillarum]
AIGKWGNTVPELRQFQLEVITNGELKSDFTSIKIRKEGQQ